MANMDIENSRDSYSCCDDFAPVAYFTLGNDWLILEANQTGVLLLGLERNKPTDKAFDDFVSKEYRDVFYSHCAKCRETPKTQTCDIRFTKEDGVQFDARLQSMAVAGQSGNPERLHVAVVEITDLKRTEGTLLDRIMTLETHNKDLERFVYVATEDLLEPLITMCSYLQVFDGRYQDILNSDTNRILRLDRLVQGLLAYSRLDTDAPIFRRIHSKVCLDQALDNLGAAINNGVARITSDPLPTVIGDSSQLVQLFQNLLSNALRFRGDDPLEIHVGAQYSDGEWRFSVRDNGIGIEPQYFDKVFRIFQQFQAGSEDFGFGVRLAICKKIVERHGGRIWFTSEPGSGSTFFFTIPSEAFNATNCKEKRVNCTDKLGCAFTIEQCGNEQLAELLEMYEEFSPKGLAQGLPPRDKSQRRSWIEKLLDCAMNFLVRKDQKVVGHASLVPTFDGLGAEYVIFVNQGYRNRGLGSRLTLHAMATARGAGLQCVCLTVEVYNLPAVRVYQKVGFKFSDQFGSERTMILVF
jgi:PAS domain S-box-containing protein